MRAAAFIRRCIRVGACLGVAALPLGAHAGTACAASLAELRALLGDPEFPLHWRETTMKDGRPLELTIGERDDVLFVSIEKDHEGVWVQGPGALCAKGENLEIHFARNTMTIGSAAHWAVRWSLAAGADFTLSRLDASRLRVRTTGWSGQFVAH